MVSLGSLGVEHARPEPTEEPVTFQWFGHTVRLATEFNEIELVDLMEASQTISGEDPRALSAVKNMLRMIIDGEDFPEFWRLASLRRQKLEDLIAVTEVLTEALTNRPTQQPSDSSTGRLSTQGNSPDVSSSAVSAGTPPRPDLVIIREDDEATRRKVKEAAAHAAASVG